MTFASDIASSRPLGVAEGLGCSLLDETVIFSRPVILTGERETLATQNARWCLLDSLRLLSRIVGPLTVVLPGGLPDGVGCTAGFCRVQCSHWLQRRIDRVVLP